MTAPCQLQAFCNLVKSFYKPGGYPDHHKNLITTVPFTTPDHWIKFHDNPFIIFLAVLVKDKQTNKCFYKHNLFYQGGKKKSYVTVLRNGFVPVL